MRKRRGDGRHERRVRGKQLGREFMREIGCREEKHSFDEETDLDLNPGSGLSWQGSNLFEPVSSYVK